MLLEVENVSKSYGKGNKILWGVNIAIQQGEIVGLVGESGSGKSTLARILMQLEPPDDGNVRFKGELVTKALRKDFYAACRLIFQNASAALNPSWNVKKILREPLQYMELDKEKHIQQMLGKVKLTDAHLKRRPAELSGGERQRVNLVRSILGNPELLICDEIVSNLDRLIQREVIDMLIDITRETGMGMLFISHDLKVIQSICERVYVMKDGEIVEECEKVDGEFIFAHTYSKKLFERNK